MKWDRPIAFLITAALWGVVNVVPNTFPEPEYGYGFPLKWTFDPAYKPAKDDDTPPYLRKYTPRELWPIRNNAIVVNILVGLAVAGIVLVVNELVQKSAGNRSPAIPPNDRP